MTDSSTGGVLPAQPPFPAEDGGLDAIFQALVASVTGLPGPMVRPRWQEVPPKQPGIRENWCAIGVVDIVSNDGPQITFSGTDDGPDTYVRHEELELLASFYGPASQANAGLLRDGLAIPQNTEQLLPYEISFVEGSSSIQAAPDLVNTRWRRQHDIRLYFRRKVIRTYQVLSIQSAEIHIFDDTYGVDRTFNVTNDGEPGNG